MRQTTRIASLTTSPCERSPVESRSSCIDADSFLLGYLKQWVLKLSAADDASGDFHERFVYEGKAFEPDSGPWYSRTAV